MLPRPAVLRTLVGDLRQVASVRRFVLEEGGDAGVECLSFSTGGGLEFWVTVGRMMDIATLSWRGVQLGWQSAAGFRRPALPLAPGGRTFNQGFGGFLNTCGFDHIRHPTADRPQHGSAPFTPARLTAQAEDWDADEPLLFCEGEAVSWAYGAGGYRLRRRIEAPVGRAVVRIRDRIEVIGAGALPVLAMYHFNLGWPLVAEGTEIDFEGRTVLGPLSPPEPAAASATLHAAASEWASCRIVAGDAPMVAMHWKTDTLPWLQLWRDLRPGSGVLSIEPCSVGRQPDGSNEPAPAIAPGEAVHFAIDIVVSDSANPPARN